MSEEGANRLLQGMLLDNPEEVFKIPGLTYKTTEINDVMDRFDRAKNARLVHRWVIQLLAETKEFRNATVPEGLFARLRSISKTDYELKNIFTKMDTAFETADVLLKQQTLDEKDKVIFEAALRYCEKSVVERMGSFDPADRLMLFWNASKLKKYLNVR